MIGTPATEAALALWANGIIGIDLGRRPGPQDWLVLAVGNSRLIPIRTHPAIIPERLGLVIYADEPPNNRALVLLARLAAGDADGSAVANDPRADARWVLDTVTRVASAL